MTTNEDTLNQPVVSSGFRVIFWFCRLRSFRFVLMFSTEIFAPYVLLPPKSGFSELSIFSWQFCCTICFRKYEFFSILRYQHFFRIDSSWKNIWFRNQNVSFPNSVRDQCISQKYSWKHFLAKLVMSGLISYWNRMILNQCSERHYRSLERFSKSSFMRTFSNPSGGASRFADSKSIPSDQRTIFHQILTVGAQRKFLPSLFVLPCEQFR